MILTNHTLAKRHNVLFTTNHILAKSHNILFSTEGELTILTNIFFFAFFFNLFQDFSLWQTVVWKEISRKTYPKKNFLLKESHRKHFLKLNLKTVNFGVYWHWSIYFPKLTLNLTAEVREISQYLAFVTLH